MGKSPPVEEAVSAAELPGDLRPGDLLFFGSLKGELTDRRQQGRFASITHVAISLGKDEMIAYQASARGGVVQVRMAGDRIMLGGQAVTVMQGSLL